MKDPKRCLIYHKWRKNNPCSRTCLKCGLEQHIHGSWNPDDNIPDRWVDMWFNKLPIKNV